MKTRAIYLPDLRYNKIQIFELKGTNFIGVDDPSFVYPVDTVISDKDWLIVSINTDNENDLKIETVRI